MKLRNDYSFSDNLLCFWATLTLSVLAVSSLGLRYATKPILCNLPSQELQEIADYAHHSCFEEDYIYVLQDLWIEPLPEQYPKPQYTYHRWVPFALGVAAVLCLLPHALWCALSGLLWIDSPHTGSVTFRQSTPACSWTSCNLARHCLTGADGIEGRQVDPRSGHCIEEAAGCVGVCGAGHAGSLGVQARTQHRTEK